MVQLLIANDFSEDLRTDRAWTNWWVQRIVWFAKHGDILVLPTLPDESFFNYALSFTEVEASSLQTIIPASVDKEDQKLTAERLANGSFRERLRHIAVDNPLHAIFPLWPDIAIADLAHWLDSSEALSGAAFMSQDGGRFVNSKSVFRAVAMGADIPVPEGGVCSNAFSLESLITRMLKPNEPVMLKQDYLSGGHGNEILSINKRFRPIGARRVVVLSKPEEINAYVADNWQRLSNSGANRIIVERYYRDSRAYFAEFLISDTTITLEGTGELLSAPFAVGQIMPAKGISPEVMGKMVDGGRRLCQVLQAIGYRGRLSADAIVTPQNDVLFSEWNGRITGSTHIYECIGNRIVGHGFAVDRIIVDRVWPSGWSVDSFSDAFEAIRRARIAYDTNSRSGVIFTNAYDSQFMGVMYCVVAENIEHAWEIDHVMESLFCNKLSNSP